MAGVSYGASPVSPTPPDEEDEDAPRFGSGGLSGYEGGLGNYQYTPTGTTNPHGMQVRRTYDMGGGGDGGGGDARRRSALDALAREIRGGYQPQRVPAPDVITSGSTEPYDRAAEAASYGRAKERTGLAAQAAMKGLRGQMSRRGIGGSGLEGEATGRLFEAGLGDLAETDRTLAEGAAGRAFTAEQANTDRRIGQTHYNTDLERWYQDANIDAQGRRMSLLAQIYGSYY
jgi:hypothetical protein